MYKPLEQDPTRRVQPTCHSKPINRDIESASVWHNVVSNVLHDIAEVLIGGRGSCSVLAIGTERLSVQRASTNSVQD